MEMPKLEQISPKYSTKDLQTHFEKKYSLTLSKGYFGYTVTDEIIILDESYFAEMKKITRQINTIFLQAYDFYISEIEKNLSGEQSFFINYLKKKFLKNEYLIGRYDVIIEKDTKTLKFIEFNANTPGMITDIYDISKLLKPKGYKNISGNFGEYIKSRFKKYIGKKIGILLPYAYADEDFLVCQDYKNMLVPLLGEEYIVIGDIFESNIAGNHFLLKGEKIDVILNFFPLEFFLTDREYAKDFFALIKNGELEILNNTESIVLQDKLLFAIIWENIKKYDLKLQKIIKKHIPFTTRRFVEDEKKFLAKIRFGRLAQGVYEKDFYGNIENKNDFIFQEKIHSHLIDENNNFLILGIFSNLKDIKAITSRKQNILITNDETIKVVPCYKKE